LSDRVAIVAGAGGPLGRAAAVKLAAAGYTVVGIDRSEDGLRELPDGIHLVRVLDLELRPQGIRVNAVAPQLIDTPKNRGFLPPDAMAHSVSPEAIAELIVFLAGDAAAPVSGAILPAYGA
jgi:NAD(P)-dependent dehydrogenase (short-subunit alcohol dehydrogenase family)